VICYFILGEISPINCGEGRFGYILRPKDSSARLNCFTCPVRCYKYRGLSVTYFTYDWKWLFGKKLEGVLLVMLNGFELNNYSWNVDSVPRFVLKFKSVWVDTVWRLFITKALKL